MSASSAPAAPRLADRHPPFFVQSLAVGDELRGLSRLDVFSRICRGKRVLHVGCIDWPITDVEESLHVQLDAVCELDGFDIHDEAFGVIGSRVRGRLFSDWEQLQPGYDVVLVPEVLEHVPDVEAFLGRLHSLNAPSYVITVPDAYSCFARHFDYDQASQSFTEIVHPRPQLLVHALHAGQRDPQVHPPGSSGTVVLQPHLPARDRDPATAGHALIVQAPAGVSTPGAGCRRSATASPCRRRSDRASANRPVPS